LKYTKYFFTRRSSLQEKTFGSKLQSTPKRKIFLQDKEKCHGKADACHGILTLYCGKRCSLERIAP
jgi:hypothetical protein